MGARITKFTLKNVRCFNSEQTLRIRPITLLVGENSAGKSTVLGSYSALVSAFGGRPFNLNKEPYKMGTFDDIISKSRKSNEGFALSMEYAGDEDTVTYKYVFIPGAGAKSYSKVIYEFRSGGSITFIVRPHTSSNKPFKILLDEFCQVKKVKDNFVIQVKSEMKHFPSMMPLLVNGALFTPQKKKTKHVQDFLVFCEKKMGFVRNIMLLMMLENIVSIAPARSKPQRTYDSTNEMITPEGPPNIASAIAEYDPAGGTIMPEGDDVPGTLARLVRAKDGAWNSLQESFKKFGVSSGMFKDISIKTFGNTMSDPFQIQIKTGRHKVNITDVGYGVSQLLPILMRVVAQQDSEECARLLLQQPEMHLHPKAQAELASLLVEFAKDGEGLNYLIETHSDYIVDRIAVEIRRGRISPDNVSLVYCESKNGNVKIHNIEFDKQGNRINVPKGYREFFMRETDRVLGLEK